jgi:tetratricopeptide (TPR) repeat protein
VEIQRRGASAWASMAEGRQSDALAEMRSAAEREDATEKNAVTPGPLSPARELLGDLLIAMKEPAQALKEYETALAKEPNRFRSLYGAGHAAALAGNRTKAREHFQQLVRICAQADTPERPEILEARRFLAAR